MASKLLSWLSRWRAEAGEATPVSVPATEESLIAASCSCDGFIRKAAVRKLARFDSAVALQAVIVRLNDWVPQVREAASVALKAFLREAYLPVLLDCLESILALERKTRADHRENLEALTALLAWPEARARVEDRFAASGRHVARFLFGVLARNVAGSGDRFLALAAGHRDVAIRVLAVSALSRFVDDDADRMLDGLMRDPHAKVRGEALRELWKRPLPPERRACLMRAGLLDASESVRALAGLLAEREGLDVGGLLAGWIGDESVRAGYAAGLLGLIGSRGFGDGLPYVRESAGHPRAVVRAAALAAWVRLDRDGADEAVTTLLGDSSSRVARLACRLVARGDVVLTRVQFEAAIASSLDRRMFRRAVETAALLSTWDRLEVLLRCLECANSPDEIRMVEAALETWSKRSSVYCATADEATAARVRERLAGAMRQEPSSKTLGRLRGTLEQAAPWVLSTPGDGRC